MIKNLMVYSLTVFFIISFSTYAFADGSVTIRWGKDSSNEQPKVYKKHKKNGPPPHAPSHGYRVKYNYRYYPDCSVYYDTSRKIYFYLEGKNWEIGVSLPSHLRVRLGQYVSIEMEADKPYTLHHEHVKKYPPGQIKEKKHKKWVKKY